MLGRFCWRGLVLLAVLCSAAACSLLETRIDCSLYDGVIGQPYFGYCSLDNPATSSTQWSVSGLPPGLSGHVSSRDRGVFFIDGTPTETGTFEGRVRAQEAFGSDNDYFTIHVSDPLVITAATLANGTEGVAYDQTVTTTGGLEPLNFSVFSGALPSGLALNTTTGNITGTPTSGGSFTFTIEARDDGFLSQRTSRAYTVLILQITTTSLPAGIESEAYGPETLAVTGQVDPVTWTVSAGALPVGLNLDAATGEISGSDTAAGAYNFTVQATDSDSPPRTDTQDVSLDIIPQLSITTAELPNATEGEAYDETIQASGGTAPYLWTEPTASFDVAGGGQSGTPCEGLTFDVNATGATTTVSGTPVNVEICGPFTARIEDSGIPPQSAQQSLSITVDPPAPPPSPAGVLARVSLASDGAEGNNHSFEAATSADGRYVAFVSSASTLVAGDSNAADDVFLRDTCAGAAGCVPSTIRVSVASDGAQGTGNSLQPSISGDGRFVAFASGASNLVAGDTNGNDDIFVRDTCIGAAGCTPSTVRVSVDNGGAEANGVSTGPSLSADGRFVAFDSVASNLVAGDTNGAADVFVHDRDTDNNGIFDEPDRTATIRVSVAGDGSQGNPGSAIAAISADGRFVAFLSNATNLVAGDTNGFQDIFVHDRDADNDGIFDEPEAIATVRMSVAGDGTQANSNSDEPAISADGRFVAFYSNASNLVTGDTNGQRDVFVHDRDADNDGIFDEAGAIATTRVSVASDGSQGSLLSTSPSLSADGRFVAFHSAASNLVAGDANGAFDVFVRDTCAGAAGCTPSTVRVSVADDGTEGDAGSTGASLSVDGRFVAFSSSATNLVAGDSNAFSDVFLAATGN